MTIHAATAKRKKQGGTQQAIAKRTYNRKSWQVLRASRVESGACPRCGKPQDSKFIHCAACREKYRKREERSRARCASSLRKFRVCRYCKVNGTLPNQLSCRECHEKHRQCQIRLRDKRRELGLCAYCGGEIETGKCCNACKLAARVKWANKQAKK